MAARTALRVVGGATGTASPNYLVRRRRQVRGAKRGVDLGVVFACSAQPSARVLSRPPPPDGTIRRAPPN